MAFEELLIDRVVIYNRTDGDTDRYGNPSDTWDSGTAHAARVQETIANELADGRRDTRNTYFTVFLLPDVTVDDTSEIVWNDKRHRVDGLPSMREDRFGPQHLELTMERIEG